MKRYTSIRVEYAIGNSDQRPETFIVDADFPIFRESIHDLAVERLSDFLSQFDAFDESVCIKRIVSEEGLTLYKMPDVARSAHIGFLELIKRAG